MTANLGFASMPYHATGMPDPATLPEAYEGVIWRRTLAYFIDLCFIGVLEILYLIVFLVLSVVSFGLLAPVLWFLFGLIPLTYHTLLLSGRRSATWGCGASMLSYAQSPANVPGSCRHWRKLPCFTLRSSQLAR